MDINNYVVLDLETTGLKVELCEITEVGILEVINGEITRRYDQLCRPDGILPERIIEITHITNEMLEGKPNFYDIVPEVLEFIGERTIVGHNIHFDLDFLVYHAKWAGHLEKNKTFKCVDTIKLAHKYMPHMKNYKLETLKKYFDISIESHRAVNDCEVTKVVFDHIMEIAKK